MQKLTCPIRYSQLKHVVLKAAQVNAVAAISQIVLFITYSQYPSATYYVYIGFLEVKICESLITVCRCRRQKRQLPVGPAWIGFLL